MWAYVRGGQVEQVYETPHSWIHEDLHHPGNRMEIENAETLATLGIYQLIKAEPPNLKTHEVGNLSYVIDETAKTVTEVYALTAKSVAEVKAFVISAINKRQHAILLETDCEIARAMEPLQFPVAQQESHAREKFDTLHTIRENTRTGVKAHIKLINAFTTVKEIADYQWTVT